jgi:Flp pilus assembly pilin Flp
LSARPMLRVRVKPLRNEGRFTAIEYGILAGLTVIAVERLATTF